MVDEVIRRLMNKRVAVNPGDYEKDGLLYCGKCDTPKQFRLHIGGADTIVPVICECRKAEIAAEDEKFRKQRIEDQKYGMRRAGIADRRYSDMTFGNSTDEIKWAHNYVDNWDKMERDNVGLMIIGSTGTGKTYAAGCIANALLDKGVSVYMSNIVSVCDKMTGLFDDERLGYINSLQKYRLMILDDFGVERGSDFVQEQIYNIIETRYRSGKPLIITSNLSLQDFRDMKDLKYARTYDRLKEMCHPVEMIGESKRRGIANKRYKEVQEVLGL